MTTGELIEALKDFHPDSEVHIYTDDWEGHMREDIEVKDTGSAVRVSGIGYLRNDPLLVVGDE